jgi:PadR family transcriptional regulator PadR
MCHFGANVSWLTMSLVSCAAASVSVILAPRLPNDRRADNAANGLQVSYFFAIIEDMREHDHLGEFELMVLLTVLRLKHDAYGVPLTRELGILRGRTVSAASVYAALDRLEIKGLVASQLGESTPERGGRAKRYFRVTDQGLRSVRETRALLSKLWKTLPRDAETLA